MKDTVIYFAYATYFGDNSILFFYITFDIIQYYMNI